MGRSDRGRVVPVERTHVEHVAANLRKADRDEVDLLTGGRDPLVVLEDAARGSEWCRTGLIDDVPAIVFGVTPTNLLASTGAPWLLGTDLVRRNPRVFLEPSPDWRDAMLMSYARLRNVVDARNRESVRWLTWLGFRMHDPVPYRDGMVRLFEMERV